MVAEDDLFVTGFFEGSVDFGADYKLEAGSPCVGAGRDLLGVFGPVDGSVNMGAYVTGSETIGVR